MRHSIHLARWRYGVLCCQLALGICHTAYAQSDGFSNRSEILFYDSSTSVWSDSAFQRIARVPDHSLNVELRPDLAWEQEALSATLKPRFAFQSEPGIRHSASSINEGWLRWRPIPGVSMQLGREALLWGPGAFWNPSNPFFGENNKENAKREVAGHDFLRGRWQVSASTSLSLISQLSDGHAGTTANRRDALKLDWVGNEASAATLFSAVPGHALDWGGWTQWTASDALIVYGEAAWQAGSTYQQAQPAPTPTGWQITSRVTNHRFNALLGAAYTFENSWTLTTELWRNGAGLDGASAKAQSEAVDSLVAQPRGMADQQLAALLQTTTPMRRRYFGLQLINGGDAKTGWALRYKYNLDDDSTESFVMIKHDVGDQLQLWGNLMLRQGKRRSEYGRWIRSSAMLGVSWFM